MGRHRWAAVPVVVSTAIGGCGGGGAVSANGQVASAVKTYLSALARGNGQVACGQLTDAAVQQLIQATASAGVTTCPAAVKEIAGQLGGDGKQKLLTATVTNVQVSGTTSIAEVRSGTNTARLSKIGGRWLIAGLTNVSTPAATTAQPSPSTTSGSTGASSSTGAASLEAKTLNKLLKLAGYRVSSVQTDTVGPAGFNAGFQATLPGSPTVSVIVYPTPQSAAIDAAGLGQGQAAGRGAYTQEGNAVILALGRGSRPRAAVDAVARRVKGIA